MYWQGMHRIILIENEAAHRVSAEAIKVIIDRLVKLEEAFNSLQELILSGGITYRPRGYDVHLNMKENYDEIYKRLDELQHRG